jgi:hypothetical protein
MNKEEMIALLKTHGITVENNISDEELKAKVLSLKPAAPAAPVPQNETHTADLAQTVKAMADELAAQRNRADQERRARVKNEVQRAVDERKIPVQLLEQYTNLAVADEKVLDTLRALPANPPGAAPLNDIQTTSPDIGNIAEEVNRTNGIARAQVIKRHGEKLRGFLIESPTNTNTIATQLKRQVILQDAIKAFSRKLGPLKAFSTRFANVALLGTDKIDVPYWALDSTSSTSFSSSYSTGNTAVSYKEVTIDQRLYQGASWTSSEFRRQPYLDLTTAMSRKAEKLAADVFDTIWGAITTSAFGAAVVTELAASFDISHVATIRQACNQAYWPTDGRALLLESAYDHYLMLDSRLGGANYLSNGAVKEGNVPRILGFDYYEVPNLPANSLNIVGAAVWPSAVLVALSPIEPSPEVRSALAAYEVVADPDTGVAFEYRRWGAASTDTASEVVECNFGYAAGEAAACKIITSA